MTSHRTPAPVVVVAADSKIHGPGAGNLRLLPTRSRGASDHDFIPIRR